MVNHSSSVSLWCFFVFFTVTYLLHSTSFSVGLFTSPFFIPLFCLLFFYLSLPLDASVSVALYLSPASELTTHSHLRLCVHMACVCVCVFQTVTLCQLHHSCSVAHFPFPQIPAQLFPSCSSSPLSAHRPVHCSTSFPLRQHSTSFCIHVNAAYRITSTTYSETIQILVV